MSCKSGYRIPVDSTNKCGWFRLPQHFIWDIICCHRVPFTRYHTMSNVMTRLTSSNDPLACGVTCYLYNTKNPPSYTVHRILMLQDAWLVSNCVNYKPYDRKFYSFTIFIYKMHLSISFTFPQTSHRIASCSSDVSRLYNTKLKNIGTCNWSNNLTFNVLSRNHYNRYATLSSRNTASILPFHVTMKMHWKIWRKWKMIQRGVWTLKLA